MKQTAEGFVLAPAILRILAFMINFAVLMVIYLALIETLGIVEFRDGQPVNPQQFAALILIVGSVYNIVFVSIWSATLGKMAMSIYVCYPNGERVRPDTAILRHIMVLLEFPLLLGMLVSTVLLFTDPRRRALHDRVAGTMVLAGRPGKPLKMVDVERSNERRL